MTAMWEVGAVSAATAVVVSLLLQPFLRVRPRPSRTKLVEAVLTPMRALQFGDLLGAPEPIRQRCPVYPIADVQCVRPAGHKVPHTVYAEDVIGAGYVRSPF